MQTNLQHSILVSSDAMSPEMQNHDDSRLQQPRSTVTSAPGKVLLTGGYLILERPNTGIVISTNARFYAVVKPLYSLTKPEILSLPWVDVRVTSPQLYRENLYKLSITSFTVQNTSSSQSTNPFVEQAVQFSVAAASTIFENDNQICLKSLLLQGLDILVLGCNEFYSFQSQIKASGLSLSEDTLARIPPFASITLNPKGSCQQNCKPEVAKTGLGSSAAMTTSVVAALLHYFGAIDLSSESGRCKHLAMLHAVAQAAHCTAQGKVGSGFDVSSAVYGSQCYSRFSPHIIYSAQGGMEGQSIRESISGILQTKWDNVRKEFSLPPLLTLMLGETGSGGSSTPSMVSAVKRWKSTDPVKSDEIWKSLCIANSALEAELTALNHLAMIQHEVYKSLLDRCSTQKSDMWAELTCDSGGSKIVNALLGARSAMLRIRELMRIMGESAGVPIEPETQTCLLNETMDLPGVLLAGIPGAGGYDAIFAVVLGESRGNVTKAWSSLGILPLLVREDARGVSLEDADPRTDMVASSIPATHVH